MAKREKKQRSDRLTRKYSSRVAQEQRQIRYITIFVGSAVAIAILALLTGLVKTKVWDPAETRRAKDALKSLPAVTVNDTMVSIADWQARVRFERQMDIYQIYNLAQQIDYYNQQLSASGSAGEFWQQLISQAQADMQEIKNLLDLGDGIAADVLEQMVEQQLIHQEAAHRGIVITPEELQDYIEVVGFGYPYPPTPTPDPRPTLPPPTLPPTVTATPEPTATVFPTPISREDFEAAYKTRVAELNKTTEMSETAWRSMIESDLYRKALLDDFEVDTNVQHVKGRYIVSGDQDTANELAARLEAGETFEMLEQELEADDSDAPVAYTGSFDWLPFGIIQQQLGEEFAKVAFNMTEGNYTSEAIAAIDGRFYLLYVEGNEERELAHDLREQQRQELFQGWLEQEKLGEGIVYGNWRDYIPREPSIQ